MAFPRHLAHGITVCGVLLLLVAAIGYGDATPTDRFVNLRGEAETQDAYTAIMQAMPTALSVASAKA
eukprot:5895201-Pleurochrysis_carterae.AAC.1